MAVRSGTSVSLEELLTRLRETDLIPSQAPLLEDIDATFARLRGAGVRNVGELRDRLNEKGGVDALAEASGVEADYLNLLRRALVGFFPKPRRLDEFLRLDKTTVTSLLAAGIRNTVQYRRALATHDLPSAVDLGISASQLEDVTSLSDLTRVQWVSPSFAEALLAAGFRHASAVAAADAESLHLALIEVNAKSAFYKGSVGMRDIKRVIGAARYADWSNEA